MLKPLKRMLKDTMGPTETLEYPVKELPRDIVENVRGFVYLARPDSCISCGACRDMCPNRVIDLVPYGKHSRLLPIFYVNMCMACGLCVEVCPTNALDFSSIVSIVSRSPRIIVTPDHSDLLTAKKQRGETRWIYTS